MKKIFIPLFIIALAVVIVLATAPEPTPEIAAADSQCHAIHLNPTDEQAYNPDPVCNPGAIDPAVTQDNLNTTICVSGYTKKVRPPVSYTNALKKKQIAEYGYFDTNLKTYEEDHIISLELGGHPRDPKNLWPEPHASMNEKDYVENYLHEQICSGQMTLAAAQDAIVHNWYGVYRHLHPPSLPELIADFITSKVGLK